MLIFFVVTEDNGYFNGIAMLPGQNINGLGKIRLVDEQYVTQPAFIERRPPHFPCREWLNQFKF